MARQIGRHALLARRFLDALLRDVPEPPSSSACAPISRR